jgi:hypothetical protein
MDTGNRCRSYAPAVAHIAVQRPAAGRMRIALRVIRRQCRDGGLHRQRERIGCGLLFGASEAAHLLALERQARAGQLRQQRKANSSMAYPKRFGSGAVGYRLWAQTQKYVTSARRNLYRPPNFRRQRLTTPGNCTSSRRCKLEFLSAAALRVELCPRRP